MVCSPYNLPQMAIILKIRHMRKATLMWERGRLCCQDRPVGKVRRMQCLAVPTIHTTYTVHRCGSAVHDGNYAGECMYVRSALPLGEGIITRVVHQPVRWNAILPHLVMDRRT